MNLSGTLMDGVRRLLEAGIDSARLDAELLLGCALGMSREELIVAASRRPSVGESERYEDLLRRRLNREPLAYITGQQEFWSLGFLVSCDVLVPRPETEILVECALKHLAKINKREARILELGTGSGAIAVALASELPQAHIVATEISPAALAIARRNASRNGVAMRFLEGDLFTALEQELEKDFDLIVSNPPYIPRDEIAHLDAEVSRWEPRTALDGGVDGLDFYRRIAEEAPGYLRPGGAVAVEIGAAIGSSVLALFRNSAAYLDAEIDQDYSGRDRVVISRTPCGRLPV